MDKFIHIRSAKFPILPGEEEELVNEGMYGKALAEYLQTRLRDRGWETPFIACEDWGWWVELKAPFAFGVCIYCGPVAGGPLDLFCTDGATSPRRWSWKRFRFVETTPWAEKLHKDLVSIFRSDPDIEIVSTTLDSPFAEPNSQPGTSSNGGPATQPGQCSAPAEGLQSPGPTTDKRTKNFSILGSRLFFFLLAPWLLLGVVVFSAIAYGQIEEKKLGGVLISVVLAMCCLCGLLIGISPRRFGWTLIFVTGSVAAGYIWYFCDTYFVEGQSISPSARRSEATPWNALLGFIFIGLPCLIFTIRRIGSWIHERRRERT